MKASGIDDSLMIKVLLIIGTRPEAIKMAPVAWALRAQSATFETVVAYTGQHRELLDQLTDILELHPDEDLRVMSQNQSLASLTGRLLDGVDSLLEKYVPDVVLAQGDTTTVTATSLACFYRRIPFEHVEAGLRTGDLQCPFPEEGNRRLSGVLAHHHYAPTAQAQSNLLAEGISPERIEVTGNTVVDALQRMLDVPAELPFERPSGPWALVTLHRRESVGPPLRQVLSALRNVLCEYPAASIVCPAHPNPNIRQLVETELEMCPNAILIEPMRYDQFVTAMSLATVILTDSGGIQEEAPSICTPLLIAREKTERPEVLRDGVAELVGYDAEIIQQRLTEFFSRSQGRADAQQGSNPCGDGCAARRIVDSLYRRYATQLLHS